MDKKEELSAELKKARTWILVVGIMMFVMDMIYIHAIWADLLPDWAKNQAMIISGVVLGVFIALWWFAQHKPKLCCALALIIFWGIQLYAVRDDPSQIYKGLVIKIFFTIALVKGLQSANRAEQLKKELEQVFG